jgi:hypothetical protein
MVVNSIPSVPPQENLPDLRPFSSVITKSWDSLQLLIRGDEIVSNPEDFGYKKLKGLHLS